MFIVCVGAFDDHNLKLTSNFRVACVENLICATEYIVNTTCIAIAWIFLFLLRILLLCCNRKHVWSLASAVFGLWMNKCFEKLHPDYDVIVWARNGLFFPMWYAALMPVFSAFMRPIKYQLKKLLLGPSEDCTAPKWNSPSKYNVNNIIIVTSIKKEKIQSYYELWILSTSEFARINYAYKWLERRLFII